MINTNLSLREQIAASVLDTIKNIQNPRIVLSTREPFEPNRLAITEFPAVLLQMDSEERETISMGMGGAGRRQGTIIYKIRGYVRGTELDAQRNELINAIELALDVDRYLGLFDQGVIDSQVTLIEVVPRMPPLAEIAIEFHVKYNYLRGES